MSRMLCAMMAMLFMASLAVVFAPAAHADDSGNITTIPLGDTINQMKSNIVAHLQYIEYGDDRKGSTQTTTPLERVKWFRLYYQYENTGDTADDGDLKLTFYDDKGNPLKLDERTYTGETVSAHSMSSLQFIELPISKDSNIVTIQVWHGFDWQNITVPQPGAATPTPAATVAPTAQPTSPATATVTPTAVPSKTGSGSCLPLLPFAILATVGIVGAVAGKKISRK